MSVLNVLYQSNNSYAVITGVSMTSLMENNRDIDEINIFVLNDKINEENISKMELLCRQYNRRIVLIDTEEILNKLVSLRVAPFKNTYTTYFKLFAINELNLATDRILQLDGDTVINGSLKELCDIDLTGYICAATYDCTMNSYKSMIGIPLTDKYYNCGVLLINQDEWISSDCQNRIVDHLANVRSGYYTVDQDIINVLFRARIKYLDLKYNYNSGFFIYGIRESLRMYNLRSPYFNTIEEITAAGREPIVYHCMGAMTGRPWEQDSIHPQNDIFDRYLKISPWHDFQKVKVNRKVIFKLQRVLYKTLPRILYIPFHKLGQRLYLAKMNENVKD